MHEAMDVGVIGCGIMGHGIAQVSAQAGYGVVLYGRAEASLERALGQIGKGLGRLEAKGALAEPAADVLARITPARELSALAGCGLVIETIDEDLPAKLALWQAVGPLLGADAVCASNTSALSIVEQAVASGRADRFIGLHFFNPPQRMPLVEVIRAVTSSDAAVALGRAYGERIGKDVVLAADRAGFIVNRLLLPYTMDAVRALETGVGTVADIDVAMKSGLGYPMGPFTLLDFVGLDVALIMCEAMFAEYREPRFAAPPTLRKLVAAGFLGRKAGRGFYDYATEPPTPLTAAVAA
jgi:3-hydroxybutyryl-CoA dehydrogenase